MHGRARVARAELAELIASPFVYATVPGRNFCSAVCMNRLFCTVGDDQWHIDDASFVVFAR